MANNKKKLSEEQLKQMQALSKMLKKQDLSGIQKPMKPTKFSFQSVLVKIFQTMQNYVKFVDQFIEFIVRKDSDKTNDVIKSAQSPIKFGIFVLVFFVFVGLIWSSTAPLDSATVAIGTMISRTNKKEISYAQGGTVEKIYVKLGDKVSVGDNLIKFDDKTIRAEYMNSLNQYRSYSASANRLLAEINGDEKIVFSEFLEKEKDLPEIAKILQTQNDLFQTKVNFQKAEVKTLTQTIEQYKKQKEGFEIKRDVLTKNLENIRKLLVSNRKLEKQGYSTKSLILDYEMKEANFVSEIATVGIEISRAEQEIIKIGIELVKLDNKYSSTALTELKDTQIQIADSRERFIASKKALKQVTITSPVSGVINNLNYHTVGSAIPPSHPIMEISPLNDTLIIETKIPPKNIDSIQIGLESKIRFSAFKSRTTPLFRGKVVSLSPDIIIDRQPQPAMDPKLAAGYYIAHIELDMEHFNELAKPRKLELYPGMQAEVQIITGTRTLLKYLLDPVIDAMFKGFKEK